MRQHSSEGEFRQSQVTYLVKPNPAGNQEIVFDASVSLFSNGRRAETKSFKIDISTSIEGAMPMAVEVDSGALKCFSQDIANELSLNCVDTEGQYVGYLEWGNIQSLMNRFHAQQGEARTLTDWYFEFANLKVL
ncbi:TPA: hypothetical protein ACPJ0X_003231 [Vibrio diabolicus]